MHCSTWFQTCQVHLHSAHPPKSAIVLCARALHVPRFLRSTSWLATLQRAHVQLAHVQHLFRDMSGLLSLYPPSKERTCSLLLVSRCVMHTSVAAHPPKEHAFGSLARAIAFRLPPFLRCSFPSVSAIVVVENWGIWLLIFLLSISYFIYYLSTCHHRARSCLSLSLCINMCARLGTPAERSHAEGLPHARSEMKLSSCRCTCPFASGCV